MTKRKTSRSSAKFTKVGLPIILALIACGGTVLAALFNSDAIMEFVTRIFPRPNISSLSVHVADQSGKAISGAKVIFFSSGGSVSQYTDSNGVSTLFVDPSVRDNVRLIVESDGYEIYEEQITSAAESSVDIRMSRKQGTNGKVVLRTVRETDSVPIHGVDVIVTVNGEIYRVTTDSDGFAVYTFPFDTGGKLDVQISANAEGYNIEDQFSTLTPGKLQYILLTPNSLRVEIPNIPASNAPPAAAVPATAAPQAAVPLPELIGSGVEITQQTGSQGLKVTFLTPDSQPWKDVYIEVNEQVTNASGNPSRGNRVASDYINEQGEINFDLPSGNYAVCPNENRGYGWTKDECVYNIQVSADKQTVVKFQGGQIEIAVVGADGQPWENVYAEVYTQKQDVNGNPVTDERVWSGYTANTGIVSSWLTPGLYAVKIDLRGYNWGKLSDGRGEINIAVQKASKTPLVIKMGRIVFGLRKPDGSPDTDVYVEVFTQKSDVNNQSATADRVWSGYTDNGGFAIIDLTKGLYTLKIGDRTLYDAVVEWGKITQTDGNTFQQK
jgi:hypothetical protein